MTIFIIICAVFLSILFNSFLEWIIHGPMEHGKLGILLGQREAHINHHTWYGRAEGFQNKNHGDSVATPYWLFIPVTLVALVVGGTIGYILGSHLFVWIFVITTMLHYLFFQYVHTSMHIPRGRWIEKTKWFRKKYAEHVVHHTVDEDFDHPVNICVVCSWADRILGTYFRKK